MTNHHTPPQLQWAILGTGNIAHKFAAALSASTNNNLHTIASRTLKSAQNFSTKSSECPAPCTYQQAIDNPAIQAIYIATPNHIHQEWTENAIIAGKAVLCEKPLAMNAEQAKKMVSLAEQHKTLLVEAYMYRFHPQTQILIDALKSGIIGDIQHIQSQFTFSLSGRPDNTRLVKNLGGGGIMDVGCYPLSLARRIAGIPTNQIYINPKSLIGQGILGQKSSVDEFAAAQLTFPNQITAHLTCGIMSAYQVYATVSGTNGYIQIPNPYKPQPKDKEAILVYNIKGQLVQKIATPDSAAIYTIQAEHFAKCYHEKQIESPLMSHQDSIDNMQLLDEWRKQVNLTFDCD